MFSRANWIYEMKVQTFFWCWKNFGKLLQYFIGRWIFLFFSFTVNWISVFIFIFVHRKNKLKKINNFQENCFSNFLLRLKFSLFYFYLFANLKRTGKTFSSCATFPFEFVFFGTKTAFLALFELKFLNFLFKIGNKKSSTVSMEISGSYFWILEDF